MDCAITACVQPLFSPFGRYVEQKGIEPSFTDCRSTVLAVVTTAPCVMRINQPSPEFSKQFSKPCGKPIPYENFKQSYVEDKGVEPLIFCVQSRCFSQLSESPMCAFLMIQPPSDVADTWCIRKYYFSLYESFGTGGIAAANSEYIHLCTPSQTRTERKLLLRQVRLPITSTGHLVRMMGLEPTKY